LRKDEAIVKYLYEHGENISKEKMNGETPLFYVCFCGNEAIVKYLVEQGADINKNKDMVKLHYLWHIKVKKNQ